MKQLAKACLALALSVFVPPAAAAELGSLAGTPYALRVTSLKEARFRHTVRQQYDFSCGSAAVATLLTYHYNYPLTEAQAFEQMYVKGDQAKIRSEGFSLLDIKRLLAGHGFAADGFELPLEKLLEAGFPAIVLVAEKGYHHFVVVKGLQGGRVLLGDPANGTRAMSREAFAAIWTNGLLFVIHDRRLKAAFNTEADWRTAPRAFAGDVIDREGMARVTLPKNGAGDF